MAKAIPAIVTPEVLVWARNLDNISIDEVAKKMKTSVEKIQEWESGITYPTLNQAKELAKFYRVPFVYFYLPDVPKKKKRLETTDYRTIGNIGNDFFISRELRWLLRDIEDRRDAVLSIYELENIQPQNFPVVLDKEANDDDIAKAIRELLGLTYEKQLRFRKSDNALSYCISALEKNDVLVFQAAKIDPKEMRGLSIAYDIAPIIVLNRKEGVSARLFTLCHELVHIITRTSGICTDTLADTVSQNQWEMRCNKIAGKVLVPISILSEHSAINTIRQYGLDDGAIMQMARDFAVSREVILHCLWEVDIIDKTEYFDTLKRYTDEYKSFLAKKNQKNGFLPPHLDAGTQVGKLYARTVLNAFYTDKISARDASSYLLNLKMKNFSKLERWCY